MTTRGEQRNKHGDKRVRFWQKDKRKRKDRFTRRKKCQCGTYPREVCEAWPRCVRIS